MIGIGIPISHRRMPRMISPRFLTSPKRQPGDEVPCSAREAATCSPTWPGLCRFRTYCR